MRLGSLRAGSWIAAVSAGSLAGGPLDHRPPAGEAPETVVDRICFGSCARQNEPQPIWERVAARDPDLWIWLGDNIYGDSRDMMVIAAKYLALAAQPGYRRLVEGCPVVATWDDHDFGVDDGGRDYPEKEHTKQLMLDFFSEPAGSARRRTPGVHTSYLLGPPERRVQVILLDLRWWRTPQKQAEPPYPGWGRYRPDDSAEAVMLGDEQWAWLERELGKPARLRLIGSSSQFGAGWNGHEAWANYPREKQRMIDLIRRTRTEGVVFLSGDTHWAELTVVEAEGVYPLFDLTSSAINQEWDPGHPRNRIGPAYGKPNFGEVAVDWEGGRVELVVRDDQGAPRVSHRVTFSELTFAAGNLGPSAGVEALAGRWQSEFGELLIERAGGGWKASYPGGACELGEDGRALVGTWREGERGGRCRFEPTRDGHFLLGAYGRDDGPVLLNWAGWRQGRRDAAGRRGD